ncbi:MAG TPA: ABC transporter ATP-binding protein, partial [Thiothrix sp.]|nr:ABC transporter ATP-binding protein [Thiothrix sp.]
MTLSNPVLTLEKVTKVFPHHTKPVDRLLARLFGKSYPQKTVLDAISFSLERGEALAILGRNGAGKSTLLKLIAGVLVADSGDIQKQGRINGLLELGTGFDENLSGCDNIAINGQLLGMSQAEIAEKKAAIIAYAELGDYIDQAVKTYSSGMVMRLGFAIAIHSEPICFIVDEALAVGDIR